MLVQITEVSKVGVMRISIITDDGIILSHAKLVGDHFHTLPLIPNTKYKYMFSTEI